jgi:hypothetical protein
MSTPSGTRTVIVHALDNIEVWGLTRGPATGWALVNGALVNEFSPGPFRLTEAAVARVTEAASRAVPAVPPHYRKLTGYQISQLPDAEAADFRARCEFVHLEGEVHGIYRVTEQEYIPAQPVTIALTREDLAP